MQNKELLTNLLTSPGKGVYTVHTGKERREKVAKQLYGMTSESEIQKKWLQSLDKSLADSAIVLLGIPSDNGGGILRGANWGPLAIREKLYTENFKGIFDIGDIRVIPHLLHDKYLNEKTIKTCRTALYGSSENSYPVSPLSIAEKIADVLFSEMDKRVLSLGGDHSVSYPVVKAWLRRQNKKNIPSAIIHFDAHTDLSSERLGVDLCFGTWARHVLDDLGKKDHLVQIGIRSTAQTKEYWEQDVGVKQYWANEVQKRGPLKISEEIIKKLKADGIKEVYISFDIDAIDSKYVSATGTPEEQGITPDQAIIIMNNISNHFTVSGADLVEVAPYILSDKKNQNSIEPESTLLTAKMIAENLIEILQK